jgi:hypothetical protein
VQHIGESLVCDRAPGMFEMTLGDAQIQHAVERKSPTNVREWPRRPSLCLTAATLAARRGATTLSVPNLRACGQTPSTVHATTTTPLRFHWDPAALGVLLAHPDGSACQMPRALVKSIRASCASKPTTLTDHPSPHACIRRVVPGSPIVRWGSMWIGISCSCT